MMGRKRNRKQDSQVRQGKYFNVFMFLSMHETCFLHDIEWEAIYKLYPDEESIVMSAYKA